MLFDKYIRIVWIFCNRASRASTIVAIKALVCNFILIFILHQVNKKRKIFFFPLCILESQLSLTLSFYTIIIIFFPQHMCELIMEGAGLFQHTSGVPVSAFHVTTDLALHQRQPLPPSGIHALYNTSILPSSVSDTRSWRFQEIFSSYWKRNSKVLFPL